MTKFHTMSSSMDTYIFSFYPRVTTIWNILPVAIYVVDTSLSILAQGLTMWLYSCICPSIIISGHATVITTLLNSSVLHVQNVSKAGISWMQRRSFPQASCMKLKQQLCFLPVQYVFLFFLLNWILTEQNMSEWLSQSKEMYIHAYIRNVLGMHQICSYIT